MFEKFFGKSKEPDKKLEFEQIKFSLSVLYNGNRRAQFFPNGDFPEQMCTISRLKEIRDKFIEEFILDYANHHPGTKLSPEDLNIEIKMIDDNNPKNLVDLI